MPYRRKRSAAAKTRRRFNRRAKRATRKGVSNAVRLTRLPYRAKLRTAGSSQIFPPTMQIVCNMQTNQNIAGTTSGIRSFKGNSFYQAGPATSYGGAYDGNVPSGLYYLIASSGAAGALAPYQSFRIHATSIHCEMISNTSDGAVGHVPMYCYIIPSLKATLAGMTISQLEEQPYCKRIVLPSSTTARPLHLSHYMSSTKIWGDPPISCFQENYEGTPAANPQNVWFWHFEVRSANETNNVDLYVNFKIKYYAELFNLNQFSTSIPS